MIISKKTGISYPEKTPWEYKKLIPQSRESIFPNLSTYISHKPSENERKSYFIYKSVIISVKKTHYLDRH